MFTSIRTCSRCFQSFRQRSRLGWHINSESQLRQTRHLNRQFPTSFGFSRPTGAWCLYARPHATADFKHELTSSFYSRCLVHTSSTVQCNKVQLSKGGSAAGQGEVELSRGDKILRFIGWLGGFYSRKAVLTRGAKVLYESCVDTVQYEQFFKACSLPDTFQSWFLVAHLHVWLCLVRLKREGKDGSLVIREVVTTFWHDVEQRMRVLGVHSSGVASWSLKELTQEFYGLTIAYEEGLLSDDKTLASALWRNLVQDKSSTDPSELARLVEYVRSQVKHMDKLDSEHILTNGHIQLLPFSH